MVLGKDGSIGPSVVLRSWPMSIELVTGTLNLVFKTSQIACICCLQHTCLKMKEMGPRMVDKSATLLQRNVC